MPVPGITENIKAHTTNTLSQIKYRIQEFANFNTCLSVNANLPRPIISGSTHHVQVNTLTFTTSKSLTVSLLHFHFICTIVHL